MSSWSSWIPFLIHSIISIISIHCLIKLCSNVAKNVKKYTERTSVNNTLIFNRERLCERCNSILASSATKNYHNKNQIKYRTLDGESYRRCVNDRENELLSSSDDDQNGQVSTREAISYDTQGENNAMLDVSHRKNSVSMLRKQFENIGDKKMVCNLERQISEKFFKRTSSPVKPTTENIDEAESEEPPIDNYYFVEKATVYTVVNNDKGVDNSSTDKVGKLILSKRSHSNGDIKGIKRSPSHDVIAEEPIFLAERTKSFEEINEDDNVEYRQMSSTTNRGSVKSFDDILRQQRFSKCYSEYSISDLLNDLPDDGDSEFAAFFNTAVCVSSKINEMTQGNDIRIAKN